jgi:ADP-ribose pyrophosphatase YjhB (NUDIX family)
MKTYPRVILTHAYRLLVGVESFFCRKIEGAQSIVVDDGKVLLIRTTYRPYWEFPGGKVEKLEMPERAAIRETKEEARVHIAQIKRKLGTYVDKRGCAEVTIHVYIAGEWEMLDLWEPNREISERAFFPIDALPPDVSPATLRRIQEYIKREQREFHEAW